MNTGKTYCWDKFLTACSILYVVFPVILFAAGWLRPSIAILFSAAIIFFALRLYKEFQAEPASLINRSTFMFWIITFALTCLWVYLSGIGGFVYQNFDFYMRNPIYRDLCGYSWPVTYDLSTQREAVQKIMGSGTVALAYYFSWWLPPAMISKIFSLGESGRDICLYLWALIGVFLVIYNIARYLRRTSYLIPVLFIFFGGMSIIGFYIIHGRLPGIAEGIGWWSGYFQYSSMTTLLFWVFNQAIGIWLIVILFLQLKSGGNALALTSLSLAYSPWAAVGTGPIVLNSILRRGKRYFIESITPQNILVSLGMAAVYGLFYMMSSGSSGTTGILVLLYPDEWKSILATHLLFVVLEFGAYFIVMGNYIKKYEYYYIVFMELLCIPFIQIISVDFVMRSTIPALFITIIFTMRFLLENGDGVGLKIRKRVLAALLVIGSLTPIIEINMTLARTIAAAAVEQRWMTRKGKVRLKPDKGLLMDAVRWIISTDTIRREAGQNKRQEQVYSIGQIRTDSESGLRMIKNQYVAYDYLNSAFFRYFGKTETHEKNISEGEDKNEIR